MTPNAFKPTGSWILPVRPRRLRARHCLTLSLALLSILSGCGTAPSGDSQLGQSAPSPAIAADTGLVERLIEEADVLKIEGGRAYVLNRYKGLLILDVSDPDHPSLLGALDLRGRGVEMYVIGQRVYAILSADYYYAYAQPARGNAALSIAPDPGPPPEFEGSQLVVIDVSNPAAPQVLSKVDLAGYADQSRRVGDVIYVAGTNLLSYAQGGVSADAPVDGSAFVASVNVADPNNVVPMDRKTFTGSGLILHVSQTRLFAASQSYDSNAAQTFTRVQVVDISDPAGTIVIRGSVMIPGFIRNRFFMDDLGDVLRIVTESRGFGVRTIKLFTYSLANVDAVTAMGSVNIIQNESAEAVRFDGPRGYVVTFLRVDPLFVIDLADPAAPVVTGELEVPGFSTHLEPRGSRLIAVGVDDTNGRRPAVAYYDVSDPQNPSQLGRVVLGPPGSYTESEALYDEKAFKVIDALGLIAVPFRHVLGNGGGGSPPGPVPLGAPEQESIKCMNAVQLVDFNDSALTQRGYFEHRGSVERVGALGPRVFALSQLGFQTVNIDNRDNPVRVSFVNFWPADEEPLYLDGCGYGVIDWPPIGIDPTFDLWRLLGLLLGGFCGSAGLMPLAALAVMAVPMRMILRRQIRR